MSTKSRFHSAPMSRTGKSEETQLPVFEKSNAGTRRRSLDTSQRSLSETSALFERGASYTLKGFPLVRQAEDLLRQNQQLRWRVDEADTAALQHTAHVQQLLTENKHLRKRLVAMEADDKRQVGAMPVPTEESVRHVETKVRARESELIRLKQRLADLAHRGAEVHSYTPFFEATPRKQTQWSTAAKSRYLADATAKGRRADGDSVASRPSTSASGVDKPADARDFRRMKKDYDKAREQLRDMRRKLEQLRKENELLVNRIDYHKIPEIPPPPPPPPQKPDALDLTLAFADPLSRLEEMHAAIVVLEDEANSLFDAAENEEPTAEVVKALFSNAQRQSIEYLKREEIYKTMLALLRTSYRQQTETCTDDEVSEDEADTAATAGDANDGAGPGSDHADGDSDVATGETESPADAAAAAAADADAGTEDSKS